MKTAIKKIPAKKKIITEADIKGPMTVYTGNRSEKELKEIAQWFATRKDARQAAASKKQLKPILPKILS